MPSRAAFAEAEAHQLRGVGCVVVHLPGGLTLAGLRAAGAPFKSPRYFESHAQDTVEYTTVTTDLAYKPELLPRSFNQPFETLQQQVAELAAGLPAALAATVAPAAAYVWLLEHHRATFGQYPFAQRYTFAVDRYQGRAQLVVGVFGQQRPLLVAPLPEGRGAGVGVWPVVVPRPVAAAGWPGVSSA